MQNDTPLMPLPAPACYQSTGVTLHDENPLIAAIPRLESERDFFKRSQYHPRTAPANESPTVRLAAVQLVSSFFQPTSRHWRLYQLLREMICDGYVGNNPLDVFSQVSVKRLPARSVLTGMPGLGKSVSVRRVLSAFPQMIGHTSFRGAPFSMVQVVSITLTCPNDGSTRTFCIDFLGAMDSLIGDNYLGRSGHRHATTSGLIQTAAKIARKHALGVLVLDDMQKLNHVKKKACETFVAAINEFSRVAGVPLFFVGNSTILKNIGFTAPLSFRNSNRVHWMRLEEDSDEWKAFLENLWACQYLRFHTSLNNRLASAFYHHTQGIPAVAIDLYTKAQQIAINDGGIEELKPDHLDRAATSFLPVQRRAIAAIRKGDLTLLHEITDLDESDVIGFAAKGSKIRPSKRGKILATVDARAPVPFDPFETARC